MDTGLLQQLLPPVSYQEQTELNVWRDGITKIENQAVAIYGSPFADVSNDYIYRWEQVLGLNVKASDSVAQRVEKVIAKLNDVGGLSIAYFTSLAESIGYSIKIVELDQFRAGIGRCTDNINLEDIVWVWQVNIDASATSLFRFRAGGSRAGELLLAFSDPIIEKIFEDLKPAYTRVLFTYTGVANETGPN